MSEEISEEIMVNYVQNIPISLLMQKLRSIFNIIILLWVSKWTTDVE